MNEMNIIEDRLKSFIDAEFYSQTYEDIKFSGADPLNHYIKLGWREGRRPNRWYSDKLIPKELIDKHPSIPPFLLFLTHLPGIDEEKFRTLCASNELPDVGHENCWACEVMRESFDGNYYRGKYSDIDQSIDALAHFCELGWQEQRDPSPIFSTRYYLDSNVDVKNANINPFVHFLSKGYEEGRKPQKHDKVKRRLLMALKTQKDISQEYLNINPKIKLASQGALFATLLEKCSKVKGLCITTSHDDYMVHTGGVQKFIRDESHHAQESGYVYFHLCPTIPNIQINKESSVSTFLVNCTLNDEFIGTFTARELADTLNSLASKQPNALQVAVIHSLMGWSIDSVIAVITEAFAHRFFYVHDYFTLCTEYRLLRNNIVPCDSPSLDSTVCNMCAHSGTRSEHLSDINYFFDKFKPTLLYPSNCAKKLFEIGVNGFGLKNKVVPHLQVIQATAPKNNLPRKRDHNQIRVAFCGAPVAHKGFYHFEQIVENCRTQKALEFFHFGSENGNIPSVKFVKTILKDGKSTMSEKLQDYKIDLVFLGSTWRETFNFVAYEAVEAGAAIISLSSGGNICDFIDVAKVGSVVNTWQECVALLKDNELAKKLDLWQATANKYAFIENKSFLTEGVM